MKIEELKRFDKFKIIKSNDCYDKTYSYERIILEVEKDSDYIINENGENLYSYMVYYIDMDSNSTLRYYEAEKVKMKCINSNSELTGWTFIENVFDTFECSIYESSSSSNRIIKEKDLEFNVKKWRNYIIYAYSRGIYCKFSPSSHIDSDYIISGIHENVEHYGTGGCLGDSFGLYNINGKIRKVVRNRNTVYYFNDLGELKSFYVKTGTNFYNKLIKTFYFSKEHFELTLNMYLLNIKK